ncbi:ML domain-containing protein [Thelephora terrestris]|uniref:Phosphatidylglycerol/phosphatidylinositol transfer protein n=1 Tax=Thelephora terrestris TaxID=56493 RepID=A0A9P6L761_9AGAM|nr:ML domain-containing protein [Thelephora terrestris]
MTRLSSVALLALAFSGVVVAAPPALQEVVVAGDVHTAAGWSYTDCGIATDIVTINSLTVSPDPPKPGQDITVTVDATTSEVIEEGAYADVTVKLGLIKILRKTFDLCEEARNANATVQCPVEKGHYVITQTASLPKEIPPGKFNVAVQGYTANDEDMLCVNMVVDFTKGFPHLW